MMKVVEEGYGSKVERNFEEKILKDIRFGF
jgi:hypothetical protein